MRACCNFSLFKLTNVDERRIHTHNGNGGHGTWGCPFPSCCTATMMIRQWNRSTTSHQRAFHELEDDTDNVGTGRLQEESMSSSENASSSNNGARATATPTVFTNFLGLTIPILSRPLYRSRVTTDPASGEEQPRNSNHDGSDYERRMGARPVTPEQCHKASTNLSPGSNLEQQALFTPSFSNTGLESFEPFDIDKHIQFPSNTPSPPPKQSPRGVDFVDSVSSSPPFNPGFCSTILPCTPETRVVTIGEAADFTIEFAPSPDRPHFSPARWDEVFVGTLASSPAQVSPASSARSKHSNPPYIPPVQVKLPQEAPNSPAIVVPVSPDTSNNTSSDRLSSLLENPPTHHNSETSGGVVQKEAPVNQISNPPPLEFSMIHSVHCRQDDISSLGADSLGESPTGIFNSYQESNKLKSASAAAHHTMETTASPTLTTEPRARRGLWCCAWLPNWFRRVPHVMQIAIFVGVALWFTAAALVALAVVLGRNNRQDSAALTKNNDWQGTTWTLPPAAAPALASRWRRQRQW